MNEIAKTILEKVTEIMELDPDKVFLDSKVQDLVGVDSVALLELFVFIERTYSVTLLEKEVRSIIIWQDLVDLIEKKIRCREQGV